jgi:hypothetical protein
MGVAVAVGALPFCGNFPAAEIKPAICDRLFPLVTSNFFGFRRALLETTKRRRIGDDFALALRLASRRRWRLALFGVAVFRFNIKLDHDNPLWFGEIYQVSLPTLTSALHSFYRP